MKANRRVPVVLRFVLDLGCQDRLLADRAELTPSVAGPELHGAVVRQRAGIELIPHEISQRLRHCTSPRTADTSTDAGLPIEYRYRYAPYKSVGHFCASVVWGMTTSDIPLHKEVVDRCAQCTRELGVPNLTTVGRSV